MSSALSKNEIESFIEYVGTKGLTLEGYKSLNRFDVMRLYYYREKDRATSEKEKKRIDNIEKILTFHKVVF